MNLQIDRNSSIGLKKQLYNELIRMILGGILLPGERLPSTRQISDQYGIARNSVVEVYEQLVAEAYAYSITGKGTFVSDISQSCVEICSINAQLNSIHNESLGKKNNQIRFIAGSPDYEGFPSKLWLDFSREYFDRNKEMNQAYPEAKGYSPLRGEIVYYLRKNKGIECNLEQVFITNGTSGALNNIALILRKEYSDLITESPVMEFVPDIFKIYDYNLHEIEVDHKGMKVDKLPKGSKSHLIYTAPSHQMPMGVSMPIDRRRELIEYAYTGQHLIIEDDYDSEFCYVGVPMNALRQIDRDHVIYLGTFSKVLSPGLRMGYMVVPEWLVQTFDELVRKTYRNVQTLDQYCLYRMMAEGAYEKQIYKMTKLYKKKREVLVSEIQKAFRNDVEIIGNNAGLHLVIRFRNRVFTTDDLKMLYNAGVEIERVSDYLIMERGCPSDSLVIGFGHLSCDEIIKGVGILARNLT